MPRKRRSPKTGRPTKYSREVARRICRNVAQGLPRQSAAALAGVAASTLYEWQNKFREFGDALEKSDAKFEAQCVASIRKAGRKSRNWTANAFLLERKFPQRYGKVDRHVIRTANEGASAPMPHAFVEAIMRALGMRGKLKPIGTPPRELPALNPAPQLPEDDDVLDALPILPN